MISIAWEHADHPVGGLDTTILTMPEQFKVDGAIAIMQFTKFLRRMSEQMAANLGERMHHAEFVVTTDPAIVESRGAMHDCEECRAGVRAALRSLRERPDRELVVGTLWWSRQ